MDDALRTLMRASIARPLAEELVEVLDKHITELDTGCDALGVAVALWLASHPVTEEGARDGVHRASRTARMTWFALHPTTETWR